MAMQALYLKQLETGKGTEEQLNHPQFTVLIPGDGQKPQAVIPRQQLVQSELGFGQSMVYAKYPYIMDQCYGVFPTYGPHISGRVMLPLNFPTEDGPIYVNAKQYNGIIRRRKYRAKAALENKVTHARKPYLHHSRHLHAMRRQRGPGGRFLNTKCSNNGKGKMETNKANKGQLSRLTGSQNSEVLQSDKEPSLRGSTISGSEVTSLYSRGDLSKWVAIADKYCCNLNV